VPSSGATVSEETDYNIKQGFLENSNVDLASEMTDMLVTQRAFELNSKSLTNADQMWNMANNLRK
jgi:flagellar basal-body rod protein FlgG